MKLCWRDIRPSFLKYNPKTTAIPEIIPVVLICTAGIISAARIHPQLALFFHRDDFHRPDSSPACSFSPQGLFLPAECISIFLFCPTGIISTDQMHLCLALLLHRDYFRRPNASLSRSFAPQGLLPPVKFIPSLLFCSSGIISTGQMHLYLALLLHRDYFGRPDSSLSRSFAPQGLFPPALFSLVLFEASGMIVGKHTQPLTTITY